MLSCAKANFTSPRSGKNPKKRKVFMQLHRSSTETFFLKNKGCISIELRGASYQLPDKDSKYSP